MTDEQPLATPALALTQLQQARVDYARTDLESARTADLTQPDAAKLILIVTRLCTRLDDILTLIDEVCDSGPPKPQP